MLETWIYRSPLLYECSLAQAFVWVMMFVSAEENAVKNNRHNTVPNELENCLY